MGVCVCVSVGEREGGGERWRECRRLVMGRYNIGILMGGNSIRRWGISVPNTSMMLCLCTVPVSLI